MRVKILVGNPALLNENAIKVSTNTNGAETPVHVAIDGNLVAIIFIADTLRPNAKETLAKLKLTGIKRLVMLTGDKRNNGKGCSR